MNTANQSTSLGLSKCCKAPVYVAHGCDSDLGHSGKPCDCGKKGAVTCWYECSKCKNPTDILGNKLQPRVDAGIEQSVLDLFVESGSDEVGDFQYKGKWYNSRFGCDLIDQVVELIGEKNSKAQAVINAWTDEGPAPEYHNRMKENLRTTWPSLYYAVRQYVSSVCGNK